jgi:hypothetical protein
MKISKRTLLIGLILICLPTHSSFNEIEEFSRTIPEAKVLVETRAFIKDLNEKRKKRIKINKSIVFSIATKVEDIASNGCDCDEETNLILKSQAHALAAGIYGVLSKDSKSIELGKKSYYGLAKARELNPNNTDAIKGQAVALNMILEKGWVVSKLASMTLGINLKDAQIELIDDLRRFPERGDLEKLAVQLEEKL